MKALNDRINNTLARLDRTQAMLLGALVACGGVGFLALGMTVYVVLAH